MFDFKEFFAKANDAARQKIEPAAMRAVEQYSAVVVGDAQQLCPVETGFLAASGTWEPVKKVADTIICVIGFNAVYAAAVHENLTARHTQGQAKYLEAAMQRDLHGFAPFVATAAAAALK